MVFFLSISSIFVSTSGQALPTCHGVEVLYTLIGNALQIYPNETLPENQVYRFEANITLTNKGYSTLDTWGVGLTFQHREVLVSASGLYPDDGRTLPANVSQGVILIPSSSQVLRNSIETAGDPGKIQRSYSIVGDEFGVPLNPMPRALNLTSTGYNCSTAQLIGVTTLHTCCVEPNSTITLTSDDTPLPPIAGDILVTYDVRQAYASNYRALVTISNESPYGRIDNWNLQWNWTEGEFIYTMQGARPKVADTQVCVAGEAGTNYPPSATMDINSAISCSTSPVIADVPLEKQNDTLVGNVKHCCRNGTILPAVIDPSKSKSAFTMNVFKLPPYAGDSMHLVPPSNFRIGDGVYTCGAPRLIAPSLFFSDSSLDYSENALKTWQVSCNKSTGATKPPPKCCVSFSSYLNDSIIPCPTCACGCAAKPQPTCSTTTPAMLLPYSALTDRPANRTDKAVVWANMNHFPVPNPLPCLDNCGVSIHWHIVSDYSKGWSARMSLFGWSNDTHPDWFAVVEMPKAMPGFEKAYTFNATQILASPSNTSFVVQGTPGYNNYLLGVTSPSVKTGVSMLQSIVSFAKGSTPGIDIKGKDGFPSKIWFNGDECAMPDTWPTSEALRMASPSTVLAAFLILIWTLSFGPLELL